MIRPAFALAAVAACLAALASLLMPAPGSGRPAPHAVAHLAAPTPHYGGTAVSSTLDELSADRAFFADLFDGAATDLDPAQAAWLADVGHRMCDLGQPRADWTASLTEPGPRQLTTGEAGKLFDVAHGAFCPGAAPAVAIAPAAYRYTPGHKVFRPAPPRVRGSWWTVTA